MKRTFLLLVCCLVSFMNFSQSKEQTDVAAAVEALRKAMVDADKKELEQLLSDNLSYGHSGGKVEDKTSMIDALSSGKSDFVTILLSEQTISITDNTAVVRHHLNGDTNDGGKPNTVHLSLMQVWIKQKGQWKLLARQAVSDHELNFRILCLF